MAIPTLNTSTLKVLEVYKAMIGRSLKGWTNGELARAVGEDNPANITRSLNTLIAAGLVEKTEEDGRFRYSDFLLKISFAHSLETETTIQRETERHRQLIAGARGLING